METNVRKLNVVKSYNNQVVDYLEVLLDRAKSGEIVEIVCAFKMVGGTYENSWTGTTNLHELVGILERMKLLTLRRMDLDGRV